MTGAIVAAAAPTSAVGVGSLLDSLDAEQRAAALVGDGPAQIIAPAGSGKTTTMIARLGVLLGRGVAAERICVLTFNRDAAAELRIRIVARLAPTHPGAEAVEARTIHALARRILLDSGRPADLVNDRLPLLRAARRRAIARLGEAAAASPAVAELDTLLSRAKVEGQPPPPEARAVLDEYAALLAVRGAVDFDDLVVGAADALERDPALRARWQGRFSHVCVDEFQDVDAAQLRLVRLLAAPQDNLYVVGDDDQTIYAWRLADVRRILGFRDAYPNAVRVDLATNYRCPRQVVEAGAQLIGHNRERFKKRILAGLAGRDGSVQAVRTDAPDWPDRLARMAADEARAGRTTCFLARTRGELWPILLALVRADEPHATSVPAPVEAEPVSVLLEALRRTPPGEHPFTSLLRLRAVHGWRRADDDARSDEEHDALDALLGWATAFRDATQFLAACDGARARLARLRDPSARIELATVHGAKGREWQTVVLLGWEEERFPNRRALLDATDAERAVEEERRLAYVAVTRATRRLLLAFDPARPTRFLAEMGYALA